MKKVININFQGRVIPIEETAYDILQQYIDSLRKYFSKEEGRDEIINDIESRIAELFSERLKKGTTCITDEDVNAVIASMGRPADFEEADADNLGGASTAGASYQQQQQAESATYATSTPGRGRLYRNADDKLLGGVCSGLANYLGIDPVVMRILFVLFFGALFWVYIILWIIVPSQSAASNITKRLYRSADDKVIGGVCGGLATYFSISTWIPRLIFALPFIIGLISGPFNMWWDDWDFWWGPKMITGSFGFTLFVTYIILWISVPVAVTAAEKLEMRGEKVDLNSIRDTVKGDLENFKSRAQNWGNEVKESAQQLGQKAKAFGASATSNVKTYSTDIPTRERSFGGNIGHVIGIIFKAFFLFIAGIIAISLFGVLLGLLFGGFVVFPFKDFVLEGFWQNLLAWVALIFFLGLPIVGLLTWLIRRIIGVRSRNHYLGYIFGGLWTIGLIAFIFLAGAFSRNFKTGSEKEVEFTMVQPANAKLLVDVQSNNIRYYGGDWYGIEWNDMPIYGINQDTLMLNTVRVNIVKSKDSLFHVHKVAFSRGKNPAIALGLAEKIRFDLQQRDSMILLPKGFAISREDKFRNQRVLVIIEVPVGKKIELDKSIYAYEWFTVNFNRRRGWNVDGDNDNWDDNYNWDANVEYIMTEKGLRRTDGRDAANYNEVSENGTDTFKTTVDANGVQLKIEGKVDRDANNRRRNNNDGGRYRYQDNNRNNSQPSKTDSTETPNEISKSASHLETVDKRDSGAMLSPMYRLGRSAR
jgi:phage shock protein PspC (stress-responsive transcriptional regulator)